MERAWCENNKSIRPKQRHKGKIKEAAYETLTNLLDRNDLILFGDFNAWTGTNTSSK